MVLSIGQSVVSRCPASLEDFLASSSRLVEASRDIRDQTKRKVTEKQGTKNLTTYILNFR